MPVVKASAVAVATLGLMGALAAVLIEPAWSVATMAVVLASVWAASVVSLGPLFWANRAPSERLIGGGMLMSGARMFLTAAAVGALVAAGLERGVVLGWGLGAYLVLLAVEVVAIARHMSVGGDSQATLNKESAA